MGCAARLPDSERFALLPHRAHQFGHLGDGPRRLVGELYSCGIHRMSGAASVSEWVCRLANRSLTDFDELSRVVAAPSGTCTRRTGSGKR